MEKPADEDIELAKKLLQKIDEIKMKMLEAGILWVRSFENLVRERCPIIGV